MKNVSPFLLTLLCCTAYAKRPIAPAPVMVEAGPTIEQRVIKNNIKISKKIDSWAESIDLFFAGEKLTDEKNDSSLRFTYFGRKQEHSKFNDDIKVDFSLRLPNTEEDWSLRFTSQDDEEFEDLNNRRAGAPPRRTRYGVSVGLLKKIGDFETSFRPGLKIKDPVETSYVLTLKNRVNNKSLSFAPKFDFFADSTKGTGQSASLGFEYELSRPYVLVWLNEEQYLDQRNIFSTRHGPGVLYKHSDKIGYTSTLTGYSTNEQDSFHLVSWDLNFSRRQEIWKRILYYNISPSWSFQKKRNFKPLADLAISIDLIF